MEPKQALQNLYQAARLSRLTADEHEAVNESVRVLKKYLEVDLEN